MGEVVHRAGWTFPNALKPLTLGLEAFRFALAMGEVVQRIGGLFSVYMPFPSARPSFSGMIGKVRFA
jgi:hypothetical protein